MTSRWMRLAGLAFGAALLMSGGASAQEAVAIKDIKVRMFYEKSGTFSDDLVPAKKSYLNAPRGEDSLPEPATSLLVTLVLSGPPNGESNRQIALHMASIVTSQQTREGKKTQNRVYNGFHFNADGLAYRAFMLENATCYPLDIEVKLGKSRKKAKLDFSCTEEKDKSS